MKIFALLFVLTFPRAAAVAAPGDGAREIPLSYYYVHGMDFSPNGALLAVTLNASGRMPGKYEQTPPRLLVVNIADGSVRKDFKLHEEDYRDVKDVLFLDDSVLLVGGLKSPRKEKDNATEYLLQRVSLADGKFKKLKLPEKFYEHQLLRRGGKPLLRAMVPGARQRLRVYSLPDFAQLVDQENRGWAFSDFKDISPDLKLYARGTGFVNGDIDLRSVSDLSTVTSLKRYKKGPYAAFSPDGRYVALGPSEAGEPSSIWTCPSGKLIHELPGAEDIRSLSFSENGLLATAHLRKALVWKVSNGKLVATLPGGKGTLSPRGDLAVTEDNFVLKLWPLAAGAAAPAAGGQKDGVAAGLALLRERDFDGAIAAYTGALETAQTPAAYLGRARAYHILGDYSKAANDARAAAGLQPKNAKAQLALGLALQGGGDLEGAMAAYTSAAGLAPDLAEALLYRGIARLQRSEVKAAVSDLSAALKLDPALAAAHFNLGLAAQSSGDSEGARGRYSEAVRLDPKNGEAYAYLGIIKYEKGESGAMADLTKAVQLSPLTVDAYNYRGVLYLKAGDKTKAYKDFMQAGNNSRDKDLTAVFNMGLIELENGWNKEAVDHFAQAEALAPGNPLYARYRALAVERRDAEISAEVAKYQKRSFNIFSAIGESMGNVATAISAGASAGGGSGSGGTTVRQGQTSRSGSYSNAAADRASSAYQERRSGAENAAARRQVEQKLWNMNNPYR